MLIDSDIIDENPDTVHLKAAQPQATGNVVGEMWVCRSRNAHSRCIGPISADRPGHSRCGPVPSSDTPSDERACERPGCGHPMDDHDGEHGCEDCVMCPAYVPPIGSRLHGQWAGSNEDPVRWCALCGTWEDEADWITHSGHASLFPTDDVRHADAVTAEPEWSTRPVQEKNGDPVDGGGRSQSEQWFVVHHNQIRSLRFGTFPIERLAQASIAACTCGPHTLRHTVTTTYTASTTEEFVAAAADRGEPTQ